MKTSLKIAAAALLALTLASITRADTITAIMGTGGIPDDGWATGTGTPSGSGISNAVQVGLRARAEYGATLTHTAYDYYTVTGVLNPTHALWNIDFSINSDLDGSTGGLNNLTAYTYQLSLVSGPSGLAGVSFDPLAAFNDNSYGNNSTGAALGVEGTAAALAGSNNIAQNSENAIFPWPGINPFVAGVYEFQLTAIPTVPHQPNPLASTTIWVNVVGVPDGGTTALLVGVALLGLGVISRRKRA